MLARNRSLRTSLPYKGKVLPIVAPAFALRPSARQAGPGYDHPMSFCEHCEGQRFDRARVLRTLRQLHKELRATDRCAGEAVSAALHAIRTMDIPHLEIVEEADEVVH
jgi:hypothetical protein